MHDDTPLDDETTRHRETNPDELRETAKEKNSAQPHPGHSTGPTSDAGKARSSMNRLTHGCRSQKTLLPDEDPEEFAHFRQGWVDCYKPADEFAEMLVEETAVAYWKYRRNTRRLEDLEFNLPADPLRWRSGDHRELALFTRYKTTAQRDFFNWLKNLEAHYNRIHRREHLDQLARTKMAAVEVQWLHRQESKMRDAKTMKKLKINQYVDVDVIDGVSRTSYFPSNQQLLDEALARDPEPILVARYLDFPNGVPPDYDWLCPDEFEKSHPVGAVQKLLLADWKNVIADEKRNRSGHIGPITPFFNSGDR